jgi:hypothetical protein
VSENTLFFAYDATLDPDRMAELAPGARFLFTAHYPETRLAFVMTESGRALPTLNRDPGHTVWGGVFEIPGPQVVSLIQSGIEEGRIQGYDQRAVDREGNKYDCLTFVTEGETNGEHHPSPEYLEAMIRGAKHWSLPAGWVLGLEDLADDPLLT